MTEEEFGAVYKRMAVLYRLEPKPEEIMEWGRLLLPYEYGGMDQALSWYAGEKSFAPKPGDLILRYRILRRQQRQAVENARTRAYVRGEAGAYQCAYCRDGGYVFVMNNGEYAPRAYPCFCRHAAPEQARRDFEALGWAFDFGRMVWRRQIPEP